MWFCIGFLLALWMCGVIVALGFVGMNDDLKPSRRWDAQQDAWRDTFR